jgi:hypothetical protein
MTTAAKAMENTVESEAVTASDMLIAVMHYERPRHLANMVASLERCAPGCRFVVIDDNSAEPESVLYLRELSTRHSVMVNRSTEAQGFYLGGLHGNMNFMLDYARQHGFKYLFYVQEDQQFVRVMDEHFFKEVTTIFQSYKNIVQVNSTFFKGFYGTDSLRRRYSYDQTGGYYFESAVKDGISDIGIVHLDRLAMREFRFAGSESESGQAAAEAGMRLVLHRNPVLMYTPWPDNPRNNQEMANALHAGLHPFEYMTEDDTARLLNRPDEIFPVAEYFLRADPNLHKPWWYTTIDHGRMREYLDLIRNMKD